MTVIDADGHVEESVSMFNLLDARYLDRRPLALGFERDTVYGIHNAVWLIDGKVYPKTVGKGAIRLGTPTIMEKARLKPFSIGAQELTDVGERLRDLDKAGIHKQVVYPTLFLTTTTEDVELEAALFRSYNSFMAQACSESHGRIKFTALVPIRDVDGSVMELHRAREAGAVAVMLLGVAWDRNLGHKNFYPFYEEAARLDVPISIHFGWGCPAITHTFEFCEFNSALLPVFMGFHSIISSGVLDAFPSLRFAFLESGSLWVAYLLQQLRRTGKVPGSKDPAGYFRDGRLYVACEADEDINYLVTCIGEDTLVAGSDYPHLDASHEGNIVQAIMGREDVPLRVREKILSANPQRLYGL